MPKLIKYLGPATGIREITVAQLEGAGVQDHEDKPVYINTHEGGERVRIVEVSDATATLLLDKEPDDWQELDAAEITAYNGERKAEADAAAAKEAAAQAERDEIEANTRRAAEEAEAARQAGAETEENANG